MSNDPIHHLIVKAHVHVQYILMQKLIRAAWVKTYHVYKTGLPGFSRKHSTFCKLYDFLSDDLATSLGQNPH